MDAPTWKTAAAAAAVAAGALLSSCSGTDVPDGPSEVAVVKTDAPDVTVAPVDRITRLDLDQTHGAADLAWGTVPTDVWLPQSVEAVAGIDGVTEDAGSIYLRVPAPYERVGARVSSEQDRSAFTDYLEIDVPVDAPATTEDQVPAPGGKVIQGIRGTVKYTLTISPDTDDDVYTIVMVKWEPAPADPDAP